MPTPIVTFTSDFGLADWFVGVVHGVINEIAPATHVVDLNHLVPPGNVTHGAFLLEAAAPDFAPGTVHLAVVDPGVGTTRRALAVAARGQLFVGPDNGLLEWALSAPGAEVYALTESRWFRQPVSRTFHGRDVFAPVAAHLALGVPLAEFGERIAEPTRLDVAHPHREKDGLMGRVVFIDRFGNALTNLTTSELEGAFGRGYDPTHMRVRFLDRKLEGLAGSYGDAPVGTLLAILGSSGRLEIAQVGGDAAGRIGMGEGDRVFVRLAPPATPA